jgi:hypothetical protein
LYHIVVRIRNEGWFVGIFEQPVAVSVAQAFLAVAEQLKIWGMVVWISRSRRGAWENGLSSTQMV